MDEYSLRKILEIAPKSAVEIDECTCTAPCECKPEETEECLTEEVPIEEESTKSTDEEDLTDELSMLSEERNLLYRRKVLCDKKARPFVSIYCSEIFLHLTWLNRSSWNGFLV